MTDVVYVVRPGDTNEELRYSLRSLANVDHGDVWIAGHCPRWVTGVWHLPVCQPDDISRYARVRRLLAAVVEDGPDRFALWNDDFFAMRPTTVDVWHRGPLATLAAARNDTWGLGLRKALAALQAHGHDDPLCYEVHAPLPLDSGLLAEALDHPAGQGIDALPWRTVYGAVHDLGGTEIPDPKIPLPDTDPDPAAAWLSTSDLSFAAGRVGAHIQARFPDPSPYEEV